MIPKKKRSHTNIRKEKVKKNGYLPLLQCSHWPRGDRKTDIIVSGWKESKKGGLDIRKSPNRMQGEEKAPGRSLRVSRTCRGKNQTSKKGAQDLKWCERGKVPQSLEREVRRFLIPENPHILAGGRSPNAIVKEIAGQTHASTRLRSMTRGEGDRKNVTAKNGQSITKRTKKNISIERQEEERSC